MDERVTSKTSDTVRRTAGAPIAVGVFGTLLITLGSTGAGWIGPGSTVRGWPIIEWPRSTQLMQNLCTFAVIIGGLLLVAAWIRLGTVLRKDPRPGNALRNVIVASVAWAVPLAVAVPLYSRDLFAYVGQGRLVLNGINPYVEGIAAERGWYAIGVDPRWANTRTPYGPVFIWIEKVVVGASGDSPVIAVAIFRILAILAVVAMAYYAYRIALLRGADPAIVLWIVAASPVTLFNFVVAGHNDALMLAMIVAAVYFALTRHPIVAVVLVTGAIGVKPIALLALPVIGILWAGRERGIKVIAGYWIVCAALAFGILGALGFALNVGFGWVAALTTPGSVAHWYAPVNWISSFSGWIVRLLGFDGDLVKSLVKLAALAVMAVVVAWVMLTRRAIDPLMRLAIAFAAAVLLSPFIHPWYAAWVIVLFGLVNLPAGWPRHLLGAASVFFAWVSVAETMDTSRAVGGADWPVVLRTVLTVGGLLGLAYYYYRQNTLQWRSIVATVRRGLSRSPRSGTR